MSAKLKRLKDDGARRSAICDHNSSMLVEAGAGSGKTAVMAGRIAMMLAQGIEPRTIAAVTFTELAASELVERVRKYVENLLEGKIPDELKVALPAGLTQKQQERLTRAREHLDELICSTIHGFCQRLIKPYPAEADIDPGASVLDRDQADLVFLETVDTWLRERLSKEDGLLAELVLKDPGKALELVRTIAQNLRGRRSLKSPPPSPLAHLVKTFRQAAAKFTKFVEAAPADEPETEAIAKRFAEMAAALAGAPDPNTPAGIAHLLTSSPHEDLCTKAGAFRKFNKKTAWGKAAKLAGLSKAEGEDLFDKASAHYESCCDTWTSLVESAAGQALSAMVVDCQEIVTRYRTYKRASALLDFDDLIYAARDLLRDHEDVRQALGKRFAHVLVDEFQDTDPLQTEIFWRLCGEPVSDSADWATFRIRPGALFLVGDPKQAIYRFRGADVRAYTEAREIFCEQHDDGFRSISTNFRSCASILTFVNRCFEAVLSAPDQPGFTALDQFHEDHTEGPIVAALDVAVADADGKASAEQQRDAEAEAVAEACARLIGNRTILDRRSGERRPCRPGDIALLAPTGTDLWRYEEALERRRIPVATQAGKGLFKRQEIQDLIALTRVLADRRDTLALGALLRGPLVGLSEEDLLDIIEGLPRSEDEPARLPRLNLLTAPEAVNHSVARAVLQKLQGLYRKAASTTPHALLSEAVDVLRVRPLLLERHHGQAERALANVDLYLSLSTGYALRGLRAFAEAMTGAWSEETRAVEGRPDAQEEAVALFTMHAAKGLEWPIVIPVNTMTAAKSPQGALIDRETNTLFCPVLGVRPAGYDAALQAEKDEVDRERVRLWYVAATRARELLVLPRLDVTPQSSAWIAAVDFPLAELPALDLSNSKPAVTGSRAVGANAQTRDQFAAQATNIAQLQKHLVWLAPSRDENATGTAVQPEAVGTWINGELDAALPVNGQPAVQGSRERGLILHKLMEEIITGELGEAESVVKRRTLELIAELGCVPTDDPRQGLSADEMAGCVVLALQIPEVAQLRPRLMAEIPVFRNSENEKTVASGIVDAIALNEQGLPEVIVDWKSDVDPEQRKLDHYRAQMRFYLEVTGATKGLIVLLTQGSMIPIDM